MDTRSPLFLLLTVSLLSAGCEASESDTQEDVSDFSSDNGGKTDNPGEAEATQPNTQPSISVLGSGRWVEPVPGAHHFWVDLETQGAPNDATVGIEYTVDDWATNETVFATYGSEQKWDVEVHLGNFADYARGKDLSPKEVEFFGFIEINGERMYDGEKINYVHHPLSSQELPVSAFNPLVPVRVSTDGRRVASGTIRTYDTNENNIVKVSYIIEGLESEAPSTMTATFEEGDDWSFSFDIGDDPTDSLLEQASYTLSYERPDGTILAESGPFIAAFPNYP